MDIVDVELFGLDAREVAPMLLNKVLDHNGVSGRIVEVEAYRGLDDPGSHAWRGPTPRTEVMHNAPGVAYVYFTYGMHWCMNVVVEPDGMPGAVLIRALAPLTELQTMFDRRGPVARNTTDLCSGPAKLCVALGIDGSLDGHDLVRGPLRLFDDAVEPPANPAVTTRIGLSRGQELRWRWCVPDNPNVSR